jgi:hypothetical protein
LMLTAIGCCVCLVLSEGIITCDVKFKDFLIFSMNFVLGLIRDKFIAY